MCGICGFLSRRGETLAVAPLWPMLQAMVHRGPDAQGHFSEPGVVAGSRRLAVIDLAGGNQPLSNEDGTIHVVLNGEIYNHRELRADLTGRGHTFRTRSDTEVLVHLWEEHGPRMLERLNGMFTFCLHDRQKRESFVARDRLGIKPLFYAHSGDELIFASEPAVLLEHPAVPREIDPLALIELYCLQFVSGTRTVYRHVHKLAPAHAIHVHDGRFEIKRYWEIPPAETTSATSEAEDVERLRELLRDSVKLQRVADVPLGLFLSGGLDSGILAGLLAEHSDQPVQTFSVGFADDAALDEREQARRVAARHGTEHHELVVSAMDTAEHLPQLVRQAAEPLMDPAILPTWLLSRFARQRVTVALSGEGADELFGGYRRYLYQNRYGWLGRLPGLQAAGRQGLGGVLPRRVGQALGAVGESEPVRNHLQWISTVGHAAGAALFDAEAYAAFDERTTDGYAGYFPSPHIRLGQQLRADQHEWLPHNLLAKVDRATMAHSLEARVPFLDHRIVEWAATLPDERKIQGTTTKVLLRRAFADLLPAESLQQPKRGFDLPLDAWLRGPLRPLARELLTPAALQAWPGVNAAGMAEMLQLHLDGRQNFGLPLYNALSVMLFLGDRA